MPITIPVVIPLVAPTSIPLDHPSTSTTKMLSIFLIEKPKMLASPKQETAIANNTLAPITSSIENTFLYPYSRIREREPANIL